ncbi:hypothetical protein Ancab_002508 [Ancistrocladus abbreviatus]
MIATAGTFCYIDPEYQQTGILGVKSDVYSLRVMLLQIETAKPPMGLAHHVERAIEKGTFKVEEALGYAKMVLKCAELRQRDRPGLGSIVLLELNRLRTLAEESLEAKGFTGIEGYYYTTPSQGSVHQVSTNSTDFTYFYQQKSCVKGPCCTKAIFFFRVRAAYL